MHPPCRATWRGAPHGLHQARRPCPLLFASHASTALWLLCTAKQGCLAQLMISLSVRHAKVRAHRVPVGAKAVLCAAAAGAAGSWAETRTHGTRRDGAAISSMQLRPDSGMQQLRVRACSACGIESRPRHPCSAQQYSSFCSETSW